MTQNALRPRLADLALVTYLAPLLEGRRVAVVGSTSGEVAQRLRALGAHTVVSFGGVGEDIAVRALTPGAIAAFHGRIDALVVPDATAVPSLVAVLDEARRALGSEGVIAVGVEAPQGPPSIEPLPRAGVTPYHDLYDLCAARFANVRMLGRGPFVGYTLAAFDDASDRVALDTRLIDGDPARPESFIAVASDSEVALDPIAVVQVPETLLETLRERGASSLRDELAETAKKLRDVEAASAERWVKIQRFEHGLKELEEENRKAREKVVRATKELEDERKLRQRIELEAQMSRRAPELPKAPDLAPELQRVRDEAARQREALERAVAEAEAGREALRAELAALGASHDALREETAAQGARLDASERELSAARSKVTDLERELDETQETEAALQAQLEEAQAAERPAFDGAAVEALRSEREALRGEAASLKTQLDAAHARLDAAQAQLDAAQAQLDAAHAQLDAAGEDPEQRRLEALLADRAAELAKVSALRDDALLALRELGLATRRTSERGEDEERAALDGELRALRERVRLLETEAVAFAGQAQQSAWRVEELEAALAQAQRAAPTAAAEGAPDAAATRAELLSMEARLVQRGMELDGLRAGSARRVAELEAEVDRLLRALETAGAQADAESRASAARAIREGAATRAELQGVRYRLREAEAALSARRAAAGAVAVEVRADQALADLGQTAERLAATEESLRETRRQLREHESELAQLRRERAVLVERVDEVMAQLDERDRRDAATEQQRRSQFIALQDRVASGELRLQSQRELLGSVRSSVSAILADGRGALVAHDLLEILRAVEGADGA